MSISTLLRKPLVVEGLRVALIMGVGDVIAQTYVEKKQISEVDFKRTLKFAGVGLFFVGPVLRIWYAGKKECSSGLLVRKNFLFQFSDLPGYRAATEVEEIRSKKYGKLETLVSPDQKPLMRGLKKMAIDQLALAPVLNAALIVILGKVNSESNEKVINRLKKDYPEIMLRNYMLWPAAQIINFSVVPLSYQVLFAQSVAVVWNTYISMVLNS